MNEIQQKLAAAAEAKRLAAQGAKQEAKQEEKKQDQKPAHELALENGLGVAKNFNLKFLVLRDGNKVFPTPEGYYIALNKEIAEQLDHFAKAGRVTIEEFKKQ